MTRILSLQAQVYRLERQLEVAESTLDVIILERVIAKIETQLEELLSAL